MPSRARDWTGVYSDRGSWQPPSAERTIQALVHRIANAEAASQWLHAMHKASFGLQMAGASLLTTLGTDGADTATYKNGVRFTIYFRKGKFLASFRGESKSDVERVARYLLAEMPDGPKLAASPSGYSKRRRAVFRFSQAGAAPYPRCCGITRLVFRYRSRGRRVLRDRLRKTM